MPAARLVFQPHVYRVILGLIQCGQSHNYKPELLLILSDEILIGIQLE